MNTIKFSQNWAQKLDNQRYFTTIRLYSQKYKIGDVVSIELKSEEIGTAKIKTANLLLIEQLPDLICFADTGYNSTETQVILKRMYPGVNWKTQKIAVLLLEWIDKKRNESVLNMPKFKKTSFRKNKPKRLKN